MNARTPGPWHTGGIFDPQSARPSVNVWGPTPSGAQSGNIVCCNAILADGRLIAAAPEVTDAAKVAYDFLSANYADTDMPDILIPLRAALAKAGAL